MAKLKSRKESKVSKIYRRETLKETNAVKRKRDESTRYRKKIFNFRVTEEEKRLIEERISVSGLGRAEFFLQSSLTQKIQVQGNIRTFTEMQKSIKEMNVLLKKWLDMSLDSFDEDSLCRHLRKSHTELETYLTLTAYRTTLESLKAALEE